MNTLIFLQVWSKDGKSAGVAVKHIVSIEPYPYTGLMTGREINSTITLVNGDKFYAKETPSELMSRIESDIFDRG